MIDLIGFWGNVTWITVLLALAPAIAFSVVLGYMVALITEDKRKGLTVQEKFIKFDYVDDYTLFFSKIKINGFGGFIVIVFSLVVWIILPAWLHENNFHDMPYSSELVLGVSQLSEKLAPFTGWVVVAAAAFIATVVFGRKAYKLYVKIDRVLQDTKT